jgi:carbonic anhydrase
MLESLHWEYRGEQDTSTWGKNYLTCSAGMEQTPINIESEVMNNLHAHFRSRTRLHIQLQKIIYTHISAAGPEYTYSCH